MDQAGTVTLLSFRGRVGSSQRSAARFTEGAGWPVPFSLVLRGGNGAPGGAGALRYGAPMGRRCVTPDTPRALQGRVCETHPETRAGGDLKACEALPPNRCASRRSTPQASVRSLRRQHGRIVGGRTLPGRAAPHECAGWLSKMIQTIVLCFERCKEHYQGRGRTVGRFSGALPASRAGRDR